MRLHIATLFLVHHPSTILFYREVGWLGIRNFDKKNWEKGILGELSRPRTDFRAKLTGRFIKILRRITSGRQGGWGIQFSFRDCFSLYLPQGRFSSLIVRMLFVCFCFLCMFSPHHVFLWSSYINQAIIIFFSISYYSFLLIVLLLPSAHAVRFSVFLCCILLCLYLGH